MHGNPNIARRTIQPGFGKRIGNRWTFALEFEILGDPPATWNEWWGSLWLWVEGRLVGRPHETEMVLTGLDSLVEVARENRTPASSILSACSSKEALEAVMWARYGGDGPPPVRLPMTNEESLFSVEVLPRRAGPFFDGWEAILVEEGATQRFVYRQEGAEVAEAVWPQGTFSRVVGDARTEFERLARSMLEGTTSVS
jgi:hypothetical protein